MVLTILLCHRGSIFFAWYSTWSFNSGDLLARRYIFWLSAVLKRSLTCRVFQNFILPEDVGVGILASYVDFLTVNHFSENHPSFVLNFQTMNLCATCLTLATYVLYVRSWALTATGFAPFTVRVLTSLLIVPVQFRHRRQFNRYCGYHKFNI